MAEETRSRLGRGLASLIGDVGAESSVERPRGQRKLPTGALRPNARNPRRVFSNTELDELTASLRERGIIQPIVARPVRGVPEAYEIIAGERRWRAAQRAGLHEVPVVIVEASDEEALQLAIIENVQRTDLNPLEEAEGYRSLIRDFAHSQDDVAKIVGKSRSHVANALRLQTLPDGVKEHIQSGRLWSAITMPSGWPTKSLRAASTCVRSRKSCAPSPAAPTNRRPRRANRRPTRAPTRWRWKSAYQMRLVWSSASTTAARAEW
jgi:ParB family transcriptional regulator, chromosome partitioning protein